MRNLFSAGVFAWIAAAVPAGAQAPQAADASSVAARYAACLVAVRPQLTDSFLGTIPGSASRSYVLNALVPAEDAQCGSFATVPNGTRLEIPEVVFAGYLAEARYILTWPGGAPPTIAGAVPAQMSDETYAARLAAAPDPVLEFPRIFGDCVVGNRAQDVDRLVRSRLGSLEEVAALAALQPAFGQCLWNGQTLEFSRETMRAVLAEALYRGVLASLSPELVQNQEEAGR